MQQIAYRTTDESELDLIQPLWQLLREHHELNSRYFKHRYAQMTWEGRKSTLLEKVAAGARMRVDLADDEGEGKIIGYCISAISDDVDPVLHGIHSITGEIDSIFVAEECRGEGIGDALMKRALSWLNNENVTAKKVIVADGNEAAWGFYQRHGFFPKFHVLEQINPNEE